jgi:hypothetical protein
MATITRRSILRGLAVSPLLANPTRALAASDLNPMDAGPRKLQLYIHGAVIIDVQPYGLVIQAPKVTMAGQLVHEYRVGYGAAGEGDDVYSGNSLALLGFKGAQQPLKVDNTKVPYLGPRTIDASQNQCSLVTPLPTNLNPMRPISKTTAGGDLFPGIRDLQTLQSLPTVLRAEFDLLSGEHVLLVGGIWKDNGKDPLVLHLRAEPGDIAYADHDASLAMSEALGFHLQLANCYLGAAAKYADPEERSLLEVKQGSTGGGVDIPPCTKGNAKKMSNYAAASRPANCVNAVVNNCGC